MLGPNPRVKPDPCGAGCGRFAPAGYAHRKSTGMDIPGRVLLDTNVVNFTLDWGEAIFDGGELPDYLPEQDMADILTLRDIFLTGQRAYWQIAISPKTYHEIQATLDRDRRVFLQNWFDELWIYWRGFFEEGDLSDHHADSLCRRLVHSQFLAAIPQPSDRELIAHAIAYGCDGFCTRDRRTIVRHRHKMNGVPLRILTPTEWWAVIAGYGGLWV